MSSGIYWIGLSWSSLILLLLITFFITVSFAGDLLSKIFEVLYSLISFFILGMTVGLSSDSFPSIFFILSFRYRSSPPSYLRICRASSSPSLLLSMSACNFFLSIFLLFNRLMMKSLLYLLLSASKSLMASMDRNPLYLLNMASMISL